MEKEPDGEFLAHKDRVNAVAFSPDGAFLVSAGQDGLVKLWRTGEWELFSTFFGHRDSATSLSFAPDGSVLATSSVDRTVRIWSFPFGREERLEKDLSTAAISPDGSTVASLEREGRIRLWSLGDDGVAGRLVHDTPATAVAFEPDAGHLLAATAGAPMVRWRLDDPPAEAERVEGDEAGVSALRFFAGGRRLAVSGREPSVRIYDTDGWDEKVRVELDGEGGGPLAVDPSAEELAVGDAGRVRIHGTAAGTLRGELEMPPREVRSVAYSPDGQWLAAAGPDERIRVWSRGSRG